MVPAPAQVGATCAWLITHTHTHTHTYTAPAQVAGDVRVLAFYYPQFHRDATNDKLWGEGYTDWVALRQALEQSEVCGGGGWCV